MQNQNSTSRSTTEPSKMMELGAVLCHMGNWDLVTGGSNRLAAKAVVRGAMDSHFGDKYHVAKLIHRGTFPVGNFTNEGLEYFSGIHSAIVFCESGVAFTKTAF